MPYRRIPFVTGEVYHIFNRSIAKQTIFSTTSDYQRIIDLCNFYRFRRPPLRFSHYNRLPNEQKEKFIEAYLHDRNKSLEILAYCIMPNHFHFLIKPLVDNAQSEFMRNIQNGYSKYFNLKYERTGSLFQFMFKAVHIETNEQLLHVSRYIHLNPVTAYVIRSRELERYPWSSLKDYLSNMQEESFIDSAEILSQFKSPSGYKEFTLDQIGYQRELAKIKHALLE